MLDIAVSMETRSLSVSRIKHSLVSGCGVNSAITMNLFRIPEIVSGIIYN